MSIIKKLLRNTIFYRPYREFSSKIILNAWIKNGRPLPPPHYYKQHVIKNLAQSNDIQIFIETGTYQGDMIHAMIPYFKQLYSIEIFKPLYDKAVRLFEKQSKVKIINGDSGEEIKNLLQNIHAPALFWLDGHFSGQGTGKTYKHTPVIEELEAIFHHSVKSHFILIDDARLFNGENDYPAIHELENFIRERSNYTQFKVENDLILICK